MCRTSSVHVSYRWSDMCYVCVVLTFTIIKQKLFASNHNSFFFLPCPPRPATKPAWWTEVRDPRNPGPSWNFDVKIQHSWVNTTHSTFKNTLQYSQPSVNSTGTMETEKKNNQQQSRDGEHFHWWFKNSNWFWIVVTSWWRELRRPLRSFSAAAWVPEWWR